MGINLALDVLDGADGGRHGGREEAIDELIRESFWMTDQEVCRAAQWADDNNRSDLLAAMAGAARRRRLGLPINEPVN